MPASRRAGDAGTEGARVRCRVAAGRWAVMTAREGLASSSGRDEVMPPGERRGGGGKEAGRAEGGRREERRTREEGVRGRGDGKWAAWKGWGRRRRRAPGWAGERARRGRGRGGGEQGSRGRDGPRRAAFSRFPFPSHPASPSLSSRLGPGAPDAASQLPGWRGRGSNCKTFRKLRGVAGRGLRGRADRGGGAQLTQATTPGQLEPPLSRLFLWTSLTAEHPLPSRLGGPLPGSGGEGAEPRPRPPGRRWGGGCGGGRAPVPCAERKHLQVSF